MDTIALTMKEQQRVAVIERVFRRELTMAEAAMVLGVSERQSFRIKARIRKEGIRGVIHGNRGRRSPRKLPSKTRQRIVELARGKYRGFNDHHLT
ncbi:MAG: helix-turn-helix domain-containing protein, partial [Candidatus Methylomirabilis sp.]